MTTFPENSLSDYTTKLPMDMCLEGRWEVGVAEILYPHSWFNVVGPRKIFLAFSHRDGEGFTVILAPGYYKNPQDIVDSLKKQVEELVAGNPGFKLSFNQNSRLASILVEDPHVAISMSSSLKELLGFKGRHFSGLGSEDGQRPVDIRQGFYLIFVYCDILEARIVGDNLVPLLSILPVEGKPGDIVYRRYEKIHYHVIQKKNFSDIRISLKRSR